MKRNVIPGALLMLLALTLVACQRSDDAAREAVVADNSAAPEKPAPGAASDTQASPGKMSAPITIDYTVIGTPIVGQPVNIDLNVSSTITDKPITLDYRVVDTSALAFPEAQVRRVALGSVNRARPSVQQVTVVPQREGRLYLNVTAEVETENGTMLKSMAIPIQVGSGPAELEVNGEVEEDAEGETVISMPADDR